jgi:hypothetical protein
MKNRLSFILFLAILFNSSSSFYGQQLWQKQEKENLTIQKKATFQKKNFPSNYEIVTLNSGVFEDKLSRKVATLKTVIELPNADGSLSKFSIQENSNFDAILQAKFPNVKSYTAKGIDDESANAKISIGTDGFHAVIYSETKETIYIDPYTRDKKEYIIYKKSSLNDVDLDFKCQVEEAESKEFTNTIFSKNLNDGNLRTYRLALACSGEYAQFHLGANQQNIPSSASDQVKKAAVLSAMNTSLTRLNGVFERELAVKLELVSNNEDILFLDATTDGMTDDDPDELIDEVQSICDATIGNANYDIGHVFSISGGTLSGLAGLGVICITGQKARGVTGLGSPVGDPYDIDLVAHELGHQFGATHTQNNSCNRTNSTAIEPGSGSTIMGYAGICPPNVKSGNVNGNSDDYFHAVSLAQIWAVIQSSGGCATLTNTNNAAPTANAGLDYSIPKSTPFKLTGTGNDADGVNTLTYNWEQLDNEIATMPPEPTNLGGPTFRSLPSKSVPVRYLPALATVVSGSLATTWEVVPSVARELNFSFVVRDNNIGGGSTARDDMKINVVDVTPFTVTAPNSAVVWDTGSTQTITWNQGVTNTAPINSATVNIKLSVDGGLTFPIILKSNTANDGSEEVIIPDNATSSARIMVEAADNIFYNINATNFTINSLTPTFIVNNIDGLQSACNSGNKSVNYNLNFDFVNGFSETVTLSSSGEPAGSNVSFNAATINADGTITMTISDFDDQTPQEYEIIVSSTSTSTTITQTLKVDFRLSSADFNELTLSSPADNATNLNLVEELQWNNDSNATSYDVEIATDLGFSTIISTGNVITNSYTTTNLVGVTEYFWRVKPKNSCGEGNFSSPFSFTTKVAAYCASTFTDELGGTEHITNVTFGAINNNSDNDIVDGYQDFTSINTNLLRSEDEQISVTFDTGGFQDHCYVFIDWNQDFEFDNDTERYDLGSRTEDVATATFTITVPNNAKIGKTRMRVVLEYDDPSDGFGLGACDADHLTEWGETEDYSVTISELFSVFTTSESCPDSNNGLIRIDVNLADYTYVATLTGESTNISQNIPATGFEFSNLAPGTYMVCVKIEELDETQCFEVNIIEAAPISLKVTAEKESNNFSFKIDEGTPPFEVYINETLVGITSQQEFNFEIFERGVLKVKTAKDCEGVYEKNIGDLLSTNNPELNVYLLKNPVKDFIEIHIPSTIESENVQVIIFDMTGKLIYKQRNAIVSEKLRIPFSNFSKGIYILKLSIKDAKPIKILKQ